MQTDWSNDLTLQFLELYSHERVIWDPRDRHHKQKHKVYDAWKRISSKMGNISIEELKFKKKSLMATFRPLIKKKIWSIRSGASADDIFQPMWFAYDLMESFLGSIYDVEETEDEFLQLDTKLGLLSPSSFQSVQNTETPAPSPIQENTKKPDPNTTTSMCRRRPKNMEICFDEAQQRMNESFDTLNYVLKRSRTDEDECEVYGKLLAIKLRKYPERMRDKIMYKIDGLLLDNPYPDEVVPTSSYSAPYHQNLARSPTYIAPLVHVHEENESSEAEIKLENSEANG